MLGPEFDRFALVYESKYSQDWREFFIKRDPAIISEVVNELTYLNECVELQVLPPIQPECAHGKGDTFTGCGFRHICLNTATVGQAHELAQGVTPTAPGR